MVFPIFSVIIPNYNSQDYIDETLRSLHNQTFKDFEVILIDDGSTDRSIEIAKKATQKYQLIASIVERPSNIIKGVSSCRNYGASLANGNWLCFLDSDDLYYPEKLNQVYDALRLYGNECHAYHHAARFFEDGTDKTLHITSAKQSEMVQDIFPILLQHNDIIMSTVVLHRNVFQKVGGFSTNLQACADYQMWLRVSKFTKWYYDRKVLLGYRVRSSSMIHGRKMKEHAREHYMVVESLKQTRLFSQSEISVVDQHLFMKQMSYYASVALKTKGKSDLFEGVLYMFRKGKVSAGFYLSMKYLKFYILGKLFNS